MADEEKVGEQVEVAELADSAEAPVEDVDVKALEERLAAAEQSAEEARKANADLLERMSGLKTAEEFEAAVGEARAAAEASAAALQRMMDRAEVRREFPDISEEMFDFVSGETKDELRTSASRMRDALQRVGVSGVPRPGGGLNPGNDSEDFDAAKAVASIPRF